MLLKMENSILILIWKDIYNTMCIIILCVLYVCIYTIHFGNTYTSSFNSKTKKIRKQNKTKLITL